MEFELIHTDKDTGARAGILRTDHGSVKTPVFMPVGTQATVKTLTPRDLEENRAQIILANTYHLFLRPGGQRIADFGGLHRFMAWNGPILTDSGGYQVYSLQELRKIDPDGVSFQSHLDGSHHRFTPENVIDIQRQLGSDIMMVLDECPAYPLDKEKIIKSAGLSLDWARRARHYYDKTIPQHSYDQWLFGIVQGGVYESVRRENANALVALDFPGYAIGGLAVGEPEEDRISMTAVCTGILPEDKPRYLMGVGKPYDLLKSIELGVDMFDCVIPTRNARNGTVFTWKGKVVIKAGRYSDDNGPIDADCTCYACQTFTRGYIRHLFNTNEILGMHLATLHNVHFYMQLMDEARKRIMNDTYAQWKTHILPFISLSQNEESK